MELRQLEYFIVVAGEMSFSRAAERANVVQSALSTSISKLEHELGVQLFDRSRQRIKLTVAGEAFRVRAAEVLRAATAARESVLEQTASVSGTIDIGMLISWGPLDFVAALGDFVEENPRVRVRSHMSQTGSWAYLPELIEGTLDLALISAPQRFPPQLEMSLLFEDPLTFVCRPDHPLAGRKVVEIADLAEEGLVGFPPGFGLRSVVDEAFHAVGLEAPLQHELMLGFPQIGELVRRGMGSAIIPDSEARRMPALSRVELTTEVLWVVYLASRPLAEVSRATARLSEIIMGVPGAIGSNDSLHRTRDAAVARPSSRAPRSGSRRPGVPAQG
ncbi:LysR family transcriptional regulator [Mycolicibacterium sp. CH28]|uniref:LysR substrate-binding domain-containing protein n=1 Tax=Mycolicibacterium sp. CH28 TaxID=2512237 RepID=UPI00107FE2E7|nr:LysR substrate-binding domain-containing protein [Mycolicibacterium sp. CH28]TGD85704.1 LysR family transcriptional regulator [Mycolicibacterium sp. CH28]